ncbi:MAG: DUF4397 domain-containing protein [Chloroflexota bacterium]
MNKQNPFLLTRLGYLSLFSAFFALIGVSIWAYMPTANADIEAAPPQVRLANLSGYQAGDSAGSFFLDGQDYAKLSYGFTTGMFDFAGNGEALTVISFQKEGDDFPSATISAQLEDGKSYTIFSMGDGDDLPITLNIVEDDLTPAPDGQAKVRFGHIAPFSDQAGSLIDIYKEDGIGQPLDNPLVNNIAYGAIQSKYDNQAADDLDLLLTGPNDQSVIKDPEKIGLEEGRVYSVYVIGDDDNQPLNLIYFVDDDFGRLVPASGADLQKSIIQVANFAPFTAEDGVVDIALNGVNYVTDFQYGWATDRREKYAIKPSGLYHVTLAESGDSLTIASENIDLEPDRTYTIVAAGNGVEQDVEIFSYEEDVSPPSNGQVRLRFINLMPLDSNRRLTSIDLVDDNGLPIDDAFNNVRYSDESVAEIAPGLLEFRITSADGSEILFDPIDVTAAAGDNLTLFAVGDGVHKPYAAYLMTNGDFGRFLPKEEDGGGGEPTGFLALAHLAPLSGGLADGVSIQLGEEVVIADAIYGSSTIYREYPAGTYPLAVSPLAGGAPIFEASVTITPGQYQTAVITGNGDSQPVTLIVAQDDLTPPAGAKLRFGHVAPIPGTAADTLVDIQLQDGTVLLEDLAYSTITNFDIQLAAGITDLQIVDQAGNVLIDPRPLTLQNGDIVTLLASGDTINESLGVFAIFANEQGYFLPLSQSMLYVAHLAPFNADVQATAVSIRLDGNEIAADVVYGDSLTVPGLTAGSHTLEIIPAGSTEVLLSETFNVEPMGEYSIFVSGDGENQSLEIYSLTDDNSSPTANTGKIRFGNLAPFAAGRLTTLVDVRFQDGTILIDDYQYGQFDPNYALVLEAGIHDLIITSADGQTVFMDLEPISIANQEIITLIATGDGVKQPLGAYAIRNYGPGEFLPLELENAEIYVAHLAPFDTSVDTTRVTVSVDGVNLLLNFGYGDSTDQYIDIEPGPHQIEIIPNDPTYPTVRKTINLSGGQDYTWIISGDDSRQPLDIISVLDDNSEPLTGESRVRFGNYAPFGSGATARLDIYDNLGEVYVDGADYGRTVDYQIFKEGPLDLTITAAGAETTLIDPIPVNLNNGDVVSLWPVGDGINQPLGVYEIRNGQTGRFIDLEDVIPTTNIPQLNVVHLAPLIKGDAAVEIRIDGVVISETFIYGDSTGYFGTTEGIHLVEIVATGTDVIIASRSINVRAGKYYTVFAIGNNDLQPLELVAYEYPNLKSLDAEQSQVNALNLAPFSARISSIVADVNLQNGETIFDRLLYKIPQNKFVEPAVYNLVITSDDGTVVFTDPLPIQLRKGEFITLVVTGDGSDNNQEMKLYAILENGKGYFIDTLSSINAPSQVYLPLYLYERDLR